MGALLYSCTNVCRRLCASGWVVTGGLMNEVALQQGDGNSELNCSHSASHFLRFLMTLVSLSVQDPSHLVGVVHPGC